MKISLGARTIVHPQPVFIIGTYDENSKPNIMNAIWGGICCSKPPSIAISIYKSRKTFSNIMVSKSFTVNIPSVKFLKEVDYLGMHSNETEDKFISTNLTPIKAEYVNAPYIKEFPFVLECKVIHNYDLGTHTMFIGEIIDLKTESDVLGENGLPDIEKVHPIIYASGNHAYFSIGQSLGDAYSIGKTM